MLSTSKVVAGGLAAATTAVLGSYFGVLGTVGAAAATSIVTALSAEVYQRSLDRTAHRLRGQRAGRGQDRRAAAQPPPPARRPVLPGIVLGSILIFALGIGLVSGVEYARGAPLSGGSEHTSVGEVLHQALPPALGGLLGTEHQPEDSSDAGGSDDRHQPGLVDELLSGL